MDINQEMLISMVENLITGVCVFELKGNKLTPLYTNEGLARMLGYSKSELEEYLKDFRFKILPNDLKIFEQAVSDTLKADGSVDAEFRTITAKGTVRWLQVRSNLYSKIDDVYTIICVVIDATERKMAEEELQVQAERMNLLSQSARDKIFDYNAKTDVMVVRIAQDNGKTGELIIQEYIENFDLTYIHPEDAELYLDVFRALLISPKNEVIEIRTKRFDNEYIWYQMNLTSIAGMEGYVTRIVGRMLNINETKIREKTLQELATTDGLTKIYNRNAVVDGINEFFRKSNNSEAIHALMIIDLDNFKAVNDCLGHSYGDKILQECASILIKNFRRLDIVGRIGGDEFVVLAKDLQQISNIDVIASKLVEQLQWELPYQDDYIKVSGSIGIAVFPYHGTMYDEIFDKADEALYSVKANGKGGYRVYRSAETRAHHINRIDGSMVFNNEIGREKSAIQYNQSLEDSVLQLLYDGSNIKSALNSALEIIISRINWQRGWFCPSISKNEQGVSIISAYINGYEYGEDKSSVIITWEKLFENNKRFSLLYDYDIESEDVRRYMHEKGVKRILYYPITQNGKYVGCFVFEDCESELTDLPKKMLNQIQSVCRFLDACVIQFNYHNEEFRDIVTKLKMIDDMDQYVYLIDEKSYTLKFINKKVQNETPEVRMGEPCYKMICGQDNVCADCIMNKLNKEDMHANCSGEAFNLSIRTWTKQSACWFEKRNENLVCMVTGTDISEYFIG